MLAKRVPPGPAGPPGDKGEKGDTGAPGTTLRVELSAGAAGERRALRQQSRFDHFARNDRVRKTLVDLARPPAAVIPDRAIAER